MTCSLKIKQRDNNLKFEDRSQNKTYKSDKEIFFYDDW